MAKDDHDASLSGKENNQSKLHLLRKKIWTDRVCFTRVGKACSSALSYNKVMQLFAQKIALRAWLTFSKKTIRQS
ncbi:hypothetical protein [Lentibacillus sp. CBA3610]|uniref:hypothetical protein n=1 Tax=Lentibacillus sp. CBA3610 TaxID=2518176 RepID=UPI001595CFB4|nr:hypothetical protein [Lentibacillus sp. CBA3610]QKY68280.1 hypothetical protein Len3610_00335 [Lentibacillus sp. CBA3610]